MKPEYVMVVPTPTPEDTPAYFLTIYRPIPFGYGATIFAVDELVQAPDAGAPLTYMGKRDGRVVVRFPASFDYMLVSSSVAKIVPREEVMDEEDDDTPAALPGQYA